MKKIIPRKSDKIASRIVDKEAVIVTLENQHTLVLNEIGTRVWEMLDGKKDLRAIAQGICDEFDVAHGTAFEDCRQFITQMKDAHAVVIKEDD